MDDVSSESSVESDASDLSLFMAEVNRGVVDFDMPGEDDLGVGMPYQMSGFAGRPSVNLDSTGNSVNFSDTTEDENLVEYFPQRNPPSLSDLVGDPLVSLVENFPQLDPPTHVFADQLVEAIPMSRGSENGGCDNFEEL